ncbi:MAG: tetratricopeptide repeat protein, partial [Deltaproteobacteria bacterium]|nr:tetratricopeptide repeat protein [Deltaproteobacteria bacterium]
MTSGKPIHRYFSKGLSFSPVILISLIIALLSGCAGNKMSVEEAKQVTLSMSEKSFVPPPRRIDDILTLLDQKGQFDPTNFGELRAKADQSPPENEDKKTLSSFYFNRGRAASFIGRYNQALEDLRIAYRYSNVKNHQLTHNLGVAEFICGNFKRAIELLELSISEKESPSAYAQLVKLYTRVGDLESAERIKNKGVA